MEPHPRNLGSDVDDVCKEHHWDVMCRRFIRRLNRFRGMYKLPVIEYREDIAQMARMDAEYCARNNALRLNTVGREGVFKLLTCEVVGYTTDAGELFYHLGNRNADFVQFMRTSHSIVGGVAIYGTSNHRYIAISLFKTSSTTMDCS